MMKRNTLATLCLLGGGLFAGQFAKADVCNNSSYNLVTNCGFETGDFTGWSGTSTTDGNSGVDVANPLANPYSGQYYAFLGSNGGTEDLSQSLATTTGLYRITFALMNDTSSSPGYLNSFQALFGGATLLSEAGVAAGNYTLYTLFGNATGSNTTLSFVSENDGGYFNLDSVSVSQAPEPSSLILLGTGALGLVGAFRRRVKI